MEKHHPPIFSLDSTVRPGLTDNSTQQADTYVCLALPASTSTELGNRLASKAFEITSTAAEITAVTRETLPANLWLQIGAVAGKAAGRVSGWPIISSPVTTITGAMLPYTAWPGANALCAVAAALEAELGSYRQKGRVSRYHLHVGYDPGYDAARQTQNWHTSFPTYTLPDQKPAFPRPPIPDYELLFVVSGHCEILWVSLDGLRASLPAAILAGLEYSGYCFDAARSGAAGWPAENVALLVPDRRRDWRIRFDQIACCGQRKWAARALAEFVDYLGDPSCWCRMVLGPGDLAIFDNAITLRAAASGDPATIIAAHARLCQ